MNQDSSHFLRNFQRLVNPKIGYVFIILIVLEFSLLPIVLTEFRKQTNFNSYVDYSYLYVILSYTLIGFGLIIFQVHKLEILSDHISLGLIILSCLVRSSLQANREQPYLFYLFFLGLFLSIYVIANWKKLKLPDIRVFIIGLMWSVGTLIVIALIHSIFESNQSTSLPQDLGNHIIREFLFQFSFVTIIEETCFRGLIFGFLILNGYKEDFAFVIQAILFWGIHYSRITSPLLFFISIPLLTISTTLIMRKYKSLYLPIMIHTIVNVFTPILIIILNRYGV